MELSKKSTQIDRPCSVLGCPNKKVVAHGFCKRHYALWYRYGSTKDRPKGAGLRYLKSLLLAPPLQECVPFPFGRHKSGRAIIGGKYASRIMCQLAHGDPPTQAHESAHSCGNGHLGCVNQGHLSWKTHNENMKDAVTHGSMERGEDRPNAKLTINDVVLIRTSLDDGPTLAAKFGVHKSTIYAIRNRKKWAWL